MSEIPCDICGCEWDNPSIICCAACHKAAKNKWKDTFAELQGELVKCQDALRTLVEAKDLHDRIEADCISRSLAPPKSMDTHLDTPRYRELKTRGWALARSLVEGP